MMIYSRHCQAAQILLLLIVIIITIISFTSWLALAFTTTTTAAAGRRTNTRTTNSILLYATRLRTNIQIPLMDLTNKSDNVDDENKNENGFIIPLPSSDFPDELATPFLYGIQMDTPLYKLIMEEAISLAAEQTTASTNMLSSTSPFLSSSPPMYGHVVWKNNDNDDNNSLVGAIGCTAEILVNAPTKEIFRNAQIQEFLTPESESHDDDDDKPSSSSTSESASSFNTVLCRGGWRFVVKEVIRSIPYPVVIVDEIQDDADDDDSNMFASVGSSTSDDDDDDDDDEHHEFNQMSTPELIHGIMLNVQSIIAQQLEDANAKNNLSPLEKSILEDNEIGSGVSAINAAAIELALAEEMSAVWAVFQTSLVDDIDPQQRRFAVAVMASELACLENNVRQEILLTRNGEERLKIVLKELKEIVGMRQARKFASKITDDVDELDKDLMVGTPKLPRWALQITKGTKIEYFWNEEYGWCSGTVTEDPVTIVDEILLTIRFDEDDEVHKLPLSAEDKIRWRPG
jgi:hypothetical protein